MGDLQDEIRRVLVERYGVAELHALAGELGINYEQLATSAKHDLAGELIGWCESHHVTGKLVAAIERSHRDVNWSLGVGDAGVKAAPTTARSSGQRRRAGMEATGIERQVERLANGMDGLRDEVGQLRADVRVLQADMGTVKRDIGELDRYVKSGSPMSKATTLAVVMGVALIVMAASMLLMVMVR